MLAPSHLISPIHCIPCAGWLDGLTVQHMAFLFNSDGILVSQGLAPFLLIAPCTTAVAAGTRPRHLNFPGLTCRSHGNESSAFALSVSACHLSPVLGTHTHTHTCLPTVLPTAKLPQHNQIRSVSCRPGKAVSDQHYLDYGPSVSKPTVSF